MIAIDTSSFIAYLAGEEGADIAAVETALAENLACLPPVVLTELLSDPRLPIKVARFFLQMPHLAVRRGFWERAGRLRARILARRRRARLADTLIAQTCLDHNLPLIARDRDYRHFARLGGLRLLP